MFFLVNVLVVSVIFIKEICWIVMNELWLQKEFIMLIIRLLDKLNIKYYV